MLFNFDMTIVWTYRERVIYDCMIANIFEEHRFFSKYPEKQLNIAAVLFGEFLWFSIM